MPRYLSVAALAVLNVTENRNKIIIIFFFFALESEKTYDHVIATLNIEMAIDVVGRVEAALVT